ncbi:MAG: SRPBCC family protein [Pseudomonadota bacterium]
MNPGLVSNPASNKTFWAILIAAMLFILSTVNAYASDSLTEEEKKLVDQGEVIVRDVSIDGQPGKTFEAIGFINTSRETILKVLTAYEKYPEFMPNVSRVDIMEKREPDVVINYTLSLPLGKIKKYRLKMSMTEPDNQTLILKWKMQKWSGLNPAETIKDTTGYWRIEEGTEKTSLVFYHVYTDPGPIPFGLEWIVDILSEKSVPETFLQTKARAEKIALNNSVNDK